MKTRTSHRRLYLPALTASAFALALAATDASAQTESTYVPTYAATRVHVHVDCNGPCGTDITVATPGAGDATPEQYAPEYAPAAPPAYEPQTVNAYPPGYVLAPMAPPPAFAPQYAYPSPVTRGTPEHDKTNPAIVIGVLTASVGALFIAGGAISNDWRGSGVPYMVLGVNLAIGGIVTAVLGGAIGHRHRMRAQFTGGVAMTQGGAVLNAGVVF